MKLIKHPLGIIYYDIIQKIYVNIIETNKFPLMYGPYKLAFSKLKNYYDHDTLKLSFTVNHSRVNFIYNLATKNISMFKVKQLQKVFSDRDVYELMKFIYLNPIETYV